MKRDYDRNTLLEGARSFAERHQFPAGRMFESGNGVLFRVREDKGRLVVEFASKDKEPSDQERCQAIAWDGERCPAEKNGQPARYCQHHEERHQGAERYAVEKQLAPDSRPFFYYYPTGNVRLWFIIAPNGQVCYTSHPSQQTDTEEPEQRRYRDVGGRPDFHGHQRRVERPWTPPRRASSRT